MIAREAFLALYLQTPEAKEWCSECLAAFVERFSTKRNRDKLSKRKLSQESEWESWGEELGTRAVAYVFKHPDPYLWLPQELACDFHLYILKTFMDVVGFDVNYEQTTLAPDAVLHSGGSHWSLSPILRRDGHVTKKRSAS